MPIILAVLRAKLRNTFLVAPLALAASFNPVSDDACAVITILNTTDLCIRTVS